MVNAVVLVATGVNVDGHREVLSVKVTTSEAKESRHQRRAPRSGRGDRGEPARRIVA